MYYGYYGTDDGFMGCLGTCGSCEDNPSCLGSCGNEFCEEFTDMYCQSGDLFDAICSSGGPEPTASPQPTSSPTPYDTVELTVSIGLYGPGVCDLAKNHTQDIRDLVSKAMTPKGNSSGYSSDDITAFVISGCDNSRRRRLSERLVTITLTFTTSLSEGNYQTAEGIYDAVSISLVDAKADLTVRLNPEAPRLTFR